MSAQEDDGEESVAGEDAGFGASYQLTLVSWLAFHHTEYLATPHELLVLDSITGEALDPELRLRSQRDTGRVKIGPLPAGLVPSFHVVGTGASDTDSVDTITLNYVAAGAGLLHVSSLGTAKFAGHTGMFSPRPDRAALWGSIGWRPAGATRKGLVGCAKVFLDDASGPHADSAQRYAAGNEMPVRLDVQDETPPAHGSLIGGLRSFYFGNIASGPHTLRVSVDDGATFIAETSFVISRVRQDALGPAAELAYEIAIDVESASDPTPAGCSGD